MDAAEPPRPAEVAPAQAPVRVEAPEIELGLGAFFMEGGATGGYMGLSPFLLDEMGESVSLRPALVLGESLPSTTRSYLAAARLDVCARVPGNYAHGAGIQLDLCGGADAGFFDVPAGTELDAPTSSQVVPYIDLGPSVGMRAEVGRLAVMLRVMGNVNVARQGYTDPTGNRADMPLAVLRFELDFSWLVHTDDPRAHPAALQP